MIRKLGLSLLLCLGVTSAAQAALSCKPTDVIDSATGLKLSGIEDLVYHAPSERLILSAHDRWNERINGLFVVALADLARGGAVTAENAVPAAKDMKPHGIALRQMKDAPDRLLVINHRHLQQELGADGSPGTLIEEYQIGADARLQGPLRSVGHAALCPANDLDWIDDDRALVSLDRTNCGGFWRFLELSRGQWRGRLAVVDMKGDGSPQNLAEDLGFPNGVLVRGAEAFVSFSREQRLARYRLGDQSLIETGSIDLGGGGDNLAQDSQGRILTAIHPDLTGFGLYSLQVWGWDTAPTRLLRLSAAGDRITTLLDDPDGRSINGATSIVEAEGLIIGGAAFDDGLIVCRPAP